MLPSHASTAFERLDEHFREAHIALQQTHQAVAETSEPYEIGIVMLALIASRVPAPAQESAVRDPGFLTLAFALVRSVRREASTAFARHCDLMAQAGGMNPL